jgi:hypothetical protein
VWASFCSSFSWLSSSFFSGLFLLFPKVPVFNYLAAVFNFVAGSANVWLHFELFKLKQLVPWAFKEGS